MSRIPEYPWLKLVENPSQEDYNYICARLYEGKFNAKTEERPL